jgi:hypothetical protein
MQMQGGKTEKGAISKIITVEESQKVFLGVACRLQHTRSYELVLMERPEINRH